MGIPTDPEYYRKYAEKNQDKLKAYRKEYYSENKDKLSVKAKQNYIKNRDERLKKAKERYHTNKTAKIQYQKSYQLKNSEKIKEYKTNYYEENKAELNTKASERRAKNPDYALSNKKWKKLNKEKVRCHSKVQKANIIKKMCSFCGSGRNLDAHHPNYNFPLIVQILCRKCHINLHRGVEWVCQ